MSYLETPIDDLKYVLVLHKEGRPMGVVSREGIPHMIAIPFKNKDPALAYAKDVEKLIGYKGVIFQRVREEE